MGNFSSPEANFGGRCLEAYAESGTDYFYWRHSECAEISLAESVEFNEGKE
jgi:hypothetical protein